MKRNLSFYLSLAMLAFLFSCSKAKEAVGIATATWHIGTVAYSSTSVQRQNDSTYIANGANNNGMQIFFAVSPAVGTYKIVNEQVAGLNHLKSDEVAVEFNSGADEVYLSTGSGSVVATVSIDADGNKVVDVPTIEVRHLRVSTSEDLGNTTADAHLEHFDF